MSMMCPSSEDAEGTFEAVVLLAEAGEFDGLSLYAVEQDPDEGRVVAGVWELGVLALIGLLVCQEHGTLATKEPLQRHLGAVLGNGHGNRSSTLAFHVAGHGTLRHANVPCKVILGTKTDCVVFYSLLYALNKFFVAHSYTVIC